MELTNTRIVPASPDVVWRGLNDPEVLKACVPGCESFEKSGENEYVVVTVAKVGPVSAKFTGRIALADIVAPTRYTLRFEGQGGAAGFAKGEAKVSLAPAEGGYTAVTYTASAQVGGKLAQIGSRLIDGAAAKLADDFFARFSECVAPSAEIATAAPALQPVRFPTGGKAIRYLALAAILAVLAWLYFKGPGVR